VRPEVLVDVEHRGTMRESLRNLAFKGMRQDLMDDANPRSRAR
jgi:hypothetical protein